jgi:hypothetical protein
MASFIEHETNWASLLGHVHHMPENLKSLRSPRETVGSRTGRMADTADESAAVLAIAKVARRHAHFAVAQTSMVHTTSTVFNRLPVLLCPVHVQSIVLMLHPEGLPYLKTFDQSTHVSKLMTLRSSFTRHYNGS